MGSQSAPGRHVLIVGWGFIGSAIGKRLLELGAHVRVLTPDPPAQLLTLGAEVVDGLVESSAFESALAGMDHVVYSAGGTLPPDAERDPATDAVRTLVPTISMLEKLRTHPGVGLTYLSSGGTVYGNPTEIPVPETAPLRPQSAYGISRMAGELYARKYALTHGLKVTVARCSNVYGPGQAVNRGQGAVAVFLHRIREKIPLVIYGDGSAIRDYIHVDDVAEAVARLIINDVDVDVVNVGSGHAHTTSDVLEMISAIVGSPAIVEYVPNRPHDVHSVVLDISRLQELTGFEPRSLEDGIRSLAAVDIEEADTEVA